MNDLKRVVISSTKKNGRIVAQQVVYKSKGFSRTKHERVRERNGKLNIVEETRSNYETKETPWT